MKSTFQKLYVYHSDFYRADR